MAPRRKPQEVIEAWYLYGNELSAPAPAPAPTSSTFSGGPLPGGVFVGCEVEVDGLGALSGMRGVVVAYDIRGNQFGVQFGADAQHVVIERSNLRIAAATSCGPAARASEETCGICLEKLPAMGHEQKYMACCGKLICVVCHVQQNDADHKSMAMHRCAFCRTPAPNSVRIEMQRLEARAVKGDARAHLQLSGHYQELSCGDQTMPDDAIHLQAMAMGHAMRTLEMGYSQGQFCMACRYEVGDPWAKQDLPRACELYALAAAQGHEHALMNLCRVLCTGSPVVRDPQRAFALLRRHILAEEQSVYANHRLGCIYHGLWPPAGPIVKQDLDLAATHFARSASDANLNTTCQRFGRSSSPHCQNCTAQRHMCSESRYNLACLAAVQGAPDEALEWLAKAVAAGFSNHNGALRDDELVTIQPLPRALLVGMRRNAAEAAAAAERARLEAEEEAQRPR